MCVCVCVSKGGEAQDEHSVRVQDWKGSRSAINAASGRLAGTRAPLYPLAIQRADQRSHNALTAWDSCVRHKYQVMASSDGR